MLASERKVRDASERRETHLHDGRDLLPLLLGRIDTSGVVRASVEKEDGLVGSILRAARRKTNRISSRRLVAAPCRRHEGRTLISFFNPSKSSPTVFLS
jgi:hypothetical protein